MRRSELPASVTRAPCASSVVPPAAAMSAMPAATAGDGFEGAVVRIDEPHPALARARGGGALFAAEACGNQRLQRALQTLLDLAVERAAAAPAARPLRRVELRAQALAFGFYRGNYVCDAASRAHS